MANTPQDQQPKEPAPQPDPSRPVSPSGERLYGAVYWLRIFLAGLFGVSAAGIGIAALVIGVLLFVGVAGLLIAWGGAWSILIIGLAVGLALWIRKQDLAEAAAPKPMVAREVFREGVGSPFGEAGFAYQEEIDAFGLVPTEPGSWTRGIWLGRAINVEWLKEQWWPIWNRLLRYAGENNIVTFSSAGGGKNAAAVMPTLLVNNENAFVNDMKGENWFVTARTRKEVFGHRIVCLNPFNLYGQELGFTEPMTAHYNPLSKLRPAQPDFAGNVNTLAEALIVSEAKDPHWSDRARQLCAGLMAHLCAVADDPAWAAELRGMLQLPAQMEVNSLPVMRQLLGLGGDPLAAFCQLAVQGRAEKVLASGEIVRALPPSSVPLVRDNLASFGENTKEVNGIVSTALGQLNFLTDPALIAFLAFSDFDFADLRREPMTIYCMVPDALMNTYYRFVRVLVQSCLNALSASAPDDQQHSVLMLLDEQAKLGGMASIREGVATLRSRKVRFWSIFQDLNQLKSLYPDAWETFLANAGVVQVMTVNDATTAEYFSKKMGDCGVMVPSESSSTHFGQSPGGATSGGGTSVSWSWQARPFFTPQRFYQLPKWQSIVFVQGLAYPVLTERLGYHVRTVAGLPNLFQPWGTVSDRPFLPYTPNPEHDPSILASERARLAMLQALDVAKAEGRAFSPVVVARGTV